MKGAKVPDPTFDASNPGGSGWIKYFTLDADHNPVPCDLKTWAGWFETADRSVAHDTIGDVRVSTVALGIDCAVREGKPELFETMVFGGPLTQKMERYATWD